MPVTSRDLDKTDTQGAVFRTLSTTIKYLSGTLKLSGKYKGSS